MSKKSLSYRDSGVDIDRGEDFVKQIAPIAKKTFHAYVQNSIGGFASVASIPKEYKEPMIVTGTDGVGTKLLLAMQQGHFDDLGQDLVAMCVNDLLTIGAKPFLFLDYYACEKIIPEQALIIVKSIAQACIKSGCALVGGETAEMPGLYSNKDFDLSGFCVGLVDKANIIDGSNISEGDVIMGLPSSGFHSNGYSLVRKVIESSNLDLKEKYEGLDGTLSTALLKGTEIYVKDIHLLLDQGRQLKGMAHITGGGLQGNLNRVLPDNCDATIDCSSWQIPELFNLIQKAGNIESSEMFKTFNMGIGYAMVCSSSEKENIQKILPQAISIGQITKGKQKVNLNF